jgi:orotidine-5'-phosphate decarboxylase
MCRTSNAGAVDLQYAEVQSEGGTRPLYEHFGLVQTSWSERIGLVVGATAPEELRHVRELLPKVSILVPGVGAQGGSAGEAMKVGWAGPGSLAVSASRSVLYASERADFAEAAARAARELRDEMVAAAGSPA